MRSADNLYGSRVNKISDRSPSLTPFNEEEKVSRANHPNWITKGDMVLDETSSKWIHRDKLARIENAELHAAGFVIPKSRSASRLKRERSDNRLDADARRPRHGSATFDSPSLSSPPSWDLRTPEEIAEVEANAYFMSTGAGGTRIPLAKSSPVPLSLDFLERGSSAVRRYESMDSDMMAYAKTRSRSASASFRDSPKKFGNNAPRKGSVTSKGSATSNRPSTRSGPTTTKESPSRPTTRSGRKTSRAKHPEGEPPWLSNSYKPDPRLPPDQQYPAEVAKRMAQEEMERDGAYGDAYDTNFRPLNRNSLLKTSDSNGSGWEWPLKPSVTTAPLQRQGSTYSTMPKISDKTPNSPMASPRPNAPSQMSPVPQTDHQTETQTFEMAQQNTDLEDKKGGCGCCVVM